MGITKKPLKTAKKKPKNIDKERTKCKACIKGTENA
jgi:hypothetical protein